MGRGPGKSNLSPDGKRRWSAAQCRNVARWRRSFPGHANIRLRAAVRVVGLEALEYEHEVDDCAFVDVWARLKDGRIVGIDILTSDDPRPLQRKRDYCKKNNVPYLLIVKSRDVNDIILKIKKWIGEI